MGRRLISMGSLISGIGLVFWFGLSVASLWGQAQPGPVDLILHNGKVLTVDSNFSIAEAVAVRGNQIAAVGRNGDVLPLAGPGTMVIDLKGKTVIPGLIDTHNHLHNYAENTYGVNLTPEQLQKYPVDWRGVRSKEDVLNQVKALMTKYKFKPGEWIQFENELNFISAGSADQAKILYDDLTQWELDKVTPDNPIAMTVGIPTFNGFLLNKKAMDMIWGKYGDFVERYGRYWLDASGKPDGHLEPPASRILFRFLPQPAPEVLAPVYKSYLEELSSSGVTTTSTRVPTSTLKAFELLDSKGDLTMRLGYGVEWEFGGITDLNTGLKPFQGLVGSGTDKIWITSLGPTAIDGATTRACTNQKRVGGPLGAIDSWYPSGQCHNDIEYRGAKGRGAPIEANYFREWAVAAARDGIRYANTHVAGDRATGVMLNIIEQLQKDMGPAATKGWAFDHCELVDPADAPRAAKLGVMFSCYALSLERASRTAASYGDKVANTLISPIKSMVDAGVKVVFETDRDTYIWHDLELFLTRKDPQGRVWGPQERIDRTTLLKMVTSWASEYLLKPDKLGSLEAGKLADLVVLDRDYMAIPVEEVSEIQPQLTVLDGKIIFVHPQFSQEYNLRPRNAIISTNKELKARRPNQEH